MPRRRSSASSSTAPGSGRRSGSRLRKISPCRRWISSVSSSVSSRPTSRATARANKPPLIPMRRWIRHPSIGMFASASARCHANTCAYTVSMSVPSRSKMSASGTPPSLTGGCATRLEPFARGAYEGERLVPVVRMEGPTERRVAKRALEVARDLARLLRRQRPCHDRQPVRPDAADVAPAVERGCKRSQRVAKRRLRRRRRLAHENREGPLRLGSLCDPRMDAFRRDRAGLELSACNPEDGVEHVQRLGEHLPSAPGEVADGEARDGEPDQPDDERLDRLGEEVAVEGRRDRAKQRCEDTCSDTTRRTAGEADENDREIKAL